QAGVARGMYGIADVALVHQYIAECLAEHGAHIDLFLYCPYHPGGVVKAFARTSEDRKPGPGMAKIAEAALNLDLTRSWVVGDRPEDIGLAEAVGASAIYLAPGGSGRPDVWSFPSLAAAASFILERIVVCAPSMASGPQRHRPTAPRRSSRPRRTRAPRRTSTRMRRRPPGPCARSSPLRSIVRQRSSLRPTRAVLWYSRVATADRPPSRTICNATT